MIEKQRQEILETLNEEQRQFLKEHIKRAKCDVWAEQMAYLKGIDKDVDHMEAEEDFLLVDIRDGGYGNRPYRCKCGKSLRYQYILKHSRKDIELRLGSECFKSIAGMDDTFIRDVKKGFTKVNRELDDILEKINEDSFQFDVYDMYRGIMSDLMQEQLDLELPLSQKQTNRIDTMMREKENKEDMDSLCLTEEQREFIEELSLDDQEQLLIKLKNGEQVYNMSDIENISLSDIAERKIALGLPLDFKEEKQMQKAMKSGKNINRINFTDILKYHGALIRGLRNTGSEEERGSITEWKEIELLIEKAKKGVGVDSNVLVSNLLEVAHKLDININDYY